MDTQEAPVHPKAEREETAYDTIFEDVEEPGELPFNLLQPTPLLLKVISGPNAGAEIGIEKGRPYILGKDSNSLRRRLPRFKCISQPRSLTVSADGVIELEDLGSKNGTLVKGSAIAEKRVVTPQDLIALGTTIFLIIDREAPQETIYSPMVPTYESMRESGDEEFSDTSLEVLDDEEDWKRKPLPLKHLISAVAS